MNQNLEYILRLDACTYYSRVGIKRQSFRKIESAGLKFTGSESSDPYLLFERDIHRWILNLIDTLGPPKMFLLTRPSQQNS